jgi:hypothetical protein
MSTVKGFRMDEQLREQFERYCREHLLAERSVIEACVLRFLETDEAERRAIAKRYADWICSRSPH